MHKQSKISFERVRGGCCVNIKFLLLLGLVFMAIFLITTPKKTNADTDQIEAEYWQYFPLVVKNYRLAQFKGIPYGPFHFGEEVADYDHPKALAFNSGFVDLGLKSDIAIDILLSEARDHDYRLIVNIGQSYPCVYWDGQTFDGAAFVNEVLGRADNIAPFYPDTVVGIILLNEPHDPQPECQPGIPPQYLYNAAQQIRAGLAAYGMEDIYLGFGSPPNFIEEGLSEAQARDGTINLSFAQWSDSIDFNAWVDIVQGAASRMSEGGHPHKIVYSINSLKFTSQELIDFNMWACVQGDAFTVTWWHWNLIDGPKDQISLSQFQSVRDVCDDFDGY